MIKVLLKLYNLQRNNEEDKEKIQKIHKGKKPNTNKSYQNKPKPTKLLKQNP
jgi:hypothetical protein